MNNDIIANLVSAQNVWNSCLRVLKARGYHLSIECNAPPEADLITKHGQITWFAERNGIQLIAQNPTELLGLAGVIEHQNPTSTEPYWWLVEGEDIQEELYSSIGISLRHNENKT